ncbi:MAG: cyclophilin-like fold protein [Candidatus Nitrosopelagicus sp.]|jgi:hypothetical protein|nr:cyclophilin-like fold protein [Candidatus Nitrosopelagicus sp.]NWJ89876.1 hypothetical protein [Marine Group I thaumarchaeote]HIA10282.1 hypothetical protein [Candidatus Nitrosopelagicus sp.]HIA96701.1 hypothetical protein [Candidatus Nitrosopelagicus sp.]HIC06057.1 hypothetical protein [Candidatus Nitrosopelagicus sp.]|tara:strand:+ start:260 stop:646 length:387 start_codon:yes stop_codon:yes gene_type:complete
MSSDSVSIINIFLEIKGKARISCQLKRHLSPRTIGLITRSMPIHDNVHRMNKSVVYIKTNIDSGMERKKTDFKKGDIAYFPTGGCICFFLNDVLDGQPMTPIGKLLSSIENLKDVKTGDILTLYSETV